MKIELKERTEAHVRIYFERTEDAEIAAMMPKAAENVEQAVEAYRKTKLPDATSYGETVYADGRYVGDIWCYCIDPADIPNAMISYCIFEKSLWNRGVATEALRLFVDIISDRFNIRTFGAFSYCNNLPSMRVLEKNGFERLEVFSENGRESAYYQLEIDR